MLSMRSLEEADQLLKEFFGRAILDSSSGLRPQEVWNGGLDQAITAKLQLDNIVYNLNLNHKV